MSWVTHDYVCEKCETRKIEMVPRHEVPQEIQCYCGGTMKRSLWINQTRVSYVDGTSRWGDVKTQRKLQLAERKARLAGNKDEQKRIKAEISKVRTASRTSKKIESSKILPEQK